MKFSRALVERIVKEELAAHIAELTEAGDDEEDKKPEKQDGEAAASSKKPEPKEPAKAAPPVNKDPTMDSDSKDVGGPPEDSGEEEVPDAEDPADDELEDERADGEGDDDRSDGKVSKEIVGKSVQSISFEPKSKLVPGAAEVVFTFDQVADPLRIVITKTGQIKYYFRGLHDQV